MTLNIGLQWCIDQGFNNVIVELDSLLVVNWMENKFNPPWSLLYTIEEAKLKDNFFETFDNKSDLMTFDIAI